MEAHLEEGRGGLKAWEPGELLAVLPSLSEDQKWPGRHSQLRPPNTHGTLECGEGDISAYEVIHYLTSCWPSRKKEN